MPTSLQSHTTGASRRAFMTASMAACAVAVPWSAWAAGSSARKKQREQDDSSDLDKLKLQEPDGQVQEPIGELELEVVGKHVDAEQQQRADGDADQEPHDDVDQGIHVSRFSGEVLRPSDR
jgi:hypothetical protein